MLIFIHAYNRPDFLPVQVDSFRQFASTTPHFVIINNAPTERLAGQINAEAQKFALETWRVPRHPHGPSSMSHQQALATSLSIMRGRSGLALLADHDVFQIKPFDWASAMAEASFCGIGQQKKHITYLWPGLLGMNRDAIPRYESLNLDCIENDGVNTDTGGGLWDYLQDNPSVRVAHVGSTNNRMNPLHLDDPDGVGLSPEFDFELIADGAFLHYGRGSNWDSSDGSFMQRKDAEFFGFMRKALACDTKK